MTTCGICVKPNTWSKCEGVDLCAPGDVGSGYVLSSKKRKQDKLEVLKILMVSVRLIFFCYSRNGRISIFLKLTSTLRSRCSLDTGSFRN